MQSRNAIQFSLGEVWASTRELAKLYYLLCLEMLMKALKIGPVCKLGNHYHELLVGCLMTILATSSDISKPGYHLIGEERRCMPEITLSILSEAEEEARKGHQLL